MQLKMTKLLLWLMLVLAAGAFPLRAEVSQSKLKKALKAYQQEQWDEALNAYQDALLDDPENPVLHFNIGDVLYKKEKYEEALQSFQKAIATKDVALQEKVYYNLGNTYYQLKKYKEAIDSYKKALDLVPEDEQAKYNLELVRAKLKEMAKKQPQQQQPQPQQKQIQPSEFAKQLKAEAERRIRQRRYKDAYDLMIQGMNSDPTVAAYRGFINRLKNVVDIEEAS